ncbi:terpene synthase family protein [Streptomyces violascens]|uniref:terpene synthase family protein n=1 Tax=Streptomyces violascens TaxID=67381 RepID=UPI0036C5D48C
MGLVGPGVWSERQFMEMDFARLCASTHPDAEAGRLALVTCWYSWLFFLDDFYAAAPTAPGGPADRALADLWAQTHPLMTPDWCRRFAQSTVSTIDEHRQELANSAAQQVPGPLEYAAMRRAGCAGKWSAELVELAHGTPLAPAIAHALPMRDLNDCFSDVLRLHNDIVSYNRETQSENEVNNGVLVVERSAGCTPQEAAELVNQVLTLRLEQFRHIADVELPAAVALHGLGPAERDIVECHVGGLRDFMAGDFAWHNSTGRYADSAPGVTPDTAAAAAGPPVAAFRVPGPTGMGTSAALLGRRPADPVSDAAPASPPRLDALGLLASAIGDPVHGTCEFPVKERALRLRAQVAGCCDDRGAFEDVCASRVLESSMMLTLLRQTRRYPAVQSSLVGFLAVRQADLGLGLLERRIAEASLGLTGPDTASQGLLGDFDHFTAGRKQMMLGTYLAVLGAAAYPELDISSLDHRGHASWVELALCSVKVLNAYGRGRPDLISDEDRAYLLERLRSARREIWEGNIGAHLLALLAVHAFAPDSQLIGDGIDAVLAVRNPDAGVPFIPDYTAFLGSVAALALAKSGAERLLLTRIGDYLCLQQNEDDGWPFTERVQQTDVEGTGAVVEFLTAVDPERYGEAIDRGRRYIAAMANADGGFPTYLRGHPTEVVMTANAVLALAPEWDRYAPVLLPAVQYLLRAQKPDGTFERSWSLSEAHAIRRVMHALRCVPEEARSGLDGALDRAAALADGYLSDSQNPDGGWGQQAGDESDPISTAHSLGAGAALGTPPWCRRGTDYLLRHQRPDGGFSSKPDQVAPRPIPYDFPHLADIFVLNALGDLQNAEAGKQKDGELL